MYNVRKKGISGDFNLGDDQGWNFDLERETCSCNQTVKGQMNSIDH